MRRRKCPELTCVRFDGEDCGEDCREADLFFFLIIFIVSQLLRCLHITYPLGIIVAVFPGISYEASDLIISHLSDLCASGPPNNK